MCIVVVTLSQHTDCILFRVSILALTWDKWPTVVVRKLTRLKVFQQEVIVMHHQEVVTHSSVLTSSHDFVADVAVSEPIPRVVFARDVNKVNETFRHVADDEDVANAVKVFVN